MKIASLKNQILIPVSGKNLRGDLTIPEQAKGLILFAHGSGSSRLSPRNQYVSRSLVEAGFATLLTDLLTEAEEREDMDTGHLRFDVEMLGDRLVEIIDWLVLNEETMGLSIGLFGASTGAAAALVAAVRREKWVRAVVSRGGRPDLAGSALGDVQCPTLLIVGSDDLDVVKLNTKALGQMQCPKQMMLVQGATHLFEEPGTLEVVAKLSAEWFAQHLC